MYYFKLKFTKMDKKKKLVASPRNDWKIDPADLEFTDKLGTGASAKVYKGKSRSISLFFPPPPSKTPAPPYLPIPRMFPSNFLFVIQADLKDKRLPSRS